MTPSNSAYKKRPFRMLRSFGSLRTQLIFWNVAALSLLLGSLGVVCRFVTLTFMMQSVNSELERSVRMFMRPPGVRRPPERDRRPPPGMGRRGMPPGPPGPPNGMNTYHPRLFYAVGQPEFPNDKTPVWDQAALNRALKGEQVWSDVIVDGEPLRVFSAPGLDLEDRKGAVQNAYPLKEVYRAVSGIDTALLLLIPVGLVGAGWMGSLLTNRILRRVQWMTQAAGSIGAEDFSRRLPVSGDDEFAELAETFNCLLGRLDLSYQEQKRALDLQRRFTADASHELKTPLTIVKGTTSLALSKPSIDEGTRQTLIEIDRAADTMAQLVQDLLFLARSDAGQIGRNPIEMLVREVLDTAICQASHNAKPDISLRIEPEDLSVTGNEAELIRLFRNLLDNAVRHTPDGGKIKVLAGGLNGNVVVEIEDTGSGIAPQHLAHLGERFYRVDASRARLDGGTGLGLSICKGILDAHGGSMAFESALGMGTTVRVSLPRN